MLPSFGCASSLPSRRGFTLIEMTIVMVVMSIVFLAVFTVYGSVSLNNAVNTGASDIRRIVDSQRSFYVGRNLGAFPVCGGAPVFVAAPSGTFPAHMIFAGQVRNLWNVANAIDSIQVGRCALPVNGINRDHFVIRFSRLPRQACAKMVVATSANAADIGLSRITINGAAVTVISTVPVLNAATQQQASGAVDFQAAHAACSDNASIDWFFRVSL